MLATHPPLDERIRRITPDWDGRCAGFESQPAARRCSSPDRYGRGWIRRWRYLPQGFSVAAATPSPSESRRTRHPAGAISWIKTRCRVKRLIMAVAHKRCLFGYCWRRRVSGVEQQLQLLQTAGRGADE
jgi:hypothetical protein